MPVETLASVEERVLDEFAGERRAGGDLTGAAPSPPVRRVYKQPGRHAWFS